MCSSRNMDRPAWTRWRTQKRLSKSSLAPEEVEFLDEIHFRHWRRSEFVRQRASRGFPWYAARAARFARRVTIVRSLAQCPSWNDEAIPARRRLPAQA